MTWLRFDYMAPLSCLIAVYSTVKSASESVEFIALCMFVTATRIFLSEHSKL